MIYELTGTLFGKRESFVVLDVGGVGYQVFLNTATIRRLPETGSNITLFTFHHVKEDGESLYGFLEENELRFFELLTSVSGVGPKSALSILESDTVENLMAAILEKRPELLTKASGIGRKTAERIILDLESKVHLSESRTRTDVMDVNAEVEEALVGLGYLRGHVKQALKEVGHEEKTLENRLKKALQILSKKRA